MNRCKRLQNVISTPGVVHHVLDVVVAHRRGRHPVGVPEVDLVPVVKPVRYHRVETRANVLVLDLAV